MPRFIIKTPNANFDGERMGVVFKDGVGSTIDNEKAKVFKAELGYEVTIEAPEKKEEPKKEEPKKPNESLVGGSAKFDSVIKIKKKDVQLGTIVAAAFEATGMTVDEWNNLTQEDRDVYIDEQIKAMSK